MGWHTELEQSLEAGMSMALQRAEDLEFFGGQKSCGIG